MLARSSEQRESMTPINAASAKNNTLTALRKQKTPHPSKVLTFEHFSERRSRGSRALRTHDVLPRKIWFRDTRHGRLDIQPPLGWFLR